ncbi:MAG: HD domain-containing protein [Anaeroplasmataceae bacterium]|nr:HD domain-containing protein [Anaeroplasmataceae bacterium]
MQIVGKVVAMNTSDGLLNVSILDEAKETWNLKAKLEVPFQIGHIYIFEVSQSFKERISYTIESYQAVSDLDMTSSDAYLRKFYAGSPISLEEAVEIIQNSIEEIQNPVIHDITKKVLEQKKKQFFLYPAGSRMHHTYVGGLAYHTIGMLRFAKTFMENYPYLKSDYLYAGILLHDLGKTDELSGIEATEFTLDGQLLGHLVIGALEINKAAESLGYGNKDEVKILEHMLISHHGQPQFGAAKRPMTPEAVALWYIDTIDSKFRVLGEELNRTESKHFTDTIGVLDKIKIYKE